MDWTGYPIALDPEAQVDGLGDLALFLGGSEDSFTGEVLKLITKGQSTPDNMDRLIVAFPREVVAWSVWMAQPEAPTAAELLAALVSAPDPVVLDPATELLPVQTDRLQLVRLTGDGSASLNLRYRLVTGQPWRSYTVVVPSPAVEVDGRLLTATDAGLTPRVSLTITVDDAPVEVPE